ncbi:MAG: hypothetical protein U0P45_07765 [Acidimicrobiales bacterium]
MLHFDRRRFLVGSLGVAGATVLASCTDGSDGSSASSTTTPKPTDPDTALARPGSAGLVDEQAYQARIEEYMAGATKDLSPGDPVSIGAHLVAAHRSPKFTWDPSAVTVDQLQPVWDHIDSWQDTRDFELMYLHWVLGLADAANPMTKIDPKVIEAIEQRMVDNRYRWDDPLPKDRIDDQWFWSENHLIIGLVNEYLAGQRMPDRTFTITGLKGADHVARSKQPILDWIAERAKFGFFEWHSHVYMKKNVTPLLTLLELAKDPELVRAAGMALDLCVMDMAAWCHNNVYAASRGRTYAKDKLTEREGTFDMFKLLFDDTDLAYQGGSDSSATYFAGSQRYRPPQVLVELATAKDPGVTRERHGIFVDGRAPIVEHPKAPYGFSFDDPKDMSFWWSQGMVGTWQLTKVSLEAAKKYRFFETEALQQVGALAAINGNDPERIEKFVRDNHAIVNFGHLREANTYGWRSDTVSLATVLDHRFGDMRDQIHAWQATVGPGAIVFTTHPRTDVPDSTEWPDDDKPGYFTGEASIPRSAQHERTGIHIYQPGWDASTNALLWGIFGYQDYTHAYVPQERFDEVRQDGNWTFVRKGDGYIALWSWRTPEWRTYDPATQPTDGQTKPFDLVAKGGPDNVWIVEVGDTSTDSSFDAFVAAISAKGPEVTNDDEGFEVAWDSPASGKVTFGSTAPFTVAGKEVPLGDLPRHQSKFGTVDHLATTYALKGDQARMELDFDQMTRTTGKA